MKIIFATHNSNKVGEVAQIIDHEHINILSLSEISYHEDIEETGSTLNENAWIKADHIHKLMGANVIAEDTGLEVFSLDMAPGVYSARYAGPERNSQDNMDLLLHNLKKSKDRSARFRTVIAAYLNGKKYTFEGIVNGSIAMSRQGTGGFGYDPIFIPEGHQQSFGILSSDIKNKISHRGRAFEQLKKTLIEL